VLLSWEKISHGSLSDKAGASVAKPVVNFYGVQRTECHLLGVLPADPPNTPKDKRTVKCAHIWPNWTDGAQLPLMGLETLDVSRPRNFLRLHRDVEEAFDHKRVTFRLVGDQLMLYVLDPALLNAARPTEIGSTGVTFAQCHQQRSLTFRNRQRPFHRLLAVHSQCAFQKARRLGWIQPQQLSDGEVWAQEMARHSLGGGGDRTVDWLKRKQAAQAAAAAGGQSAVASAPSASASSSASSPPAATAFASLPSPSLASFPPPSAPASARSSAAGSSGQQRHGGSGKRGGGHGHGRARAQGAPSAQQTATAAASAGPSGK
jgi:hypothetical protein